MHVFVDDQNASEEAISEVSFASVSKRVFMRNHSYENVLRLQAHFHAKFRTKTRFETEAQGNSEMTYSLRVIHVNSIRVT